MDTFTALAEPTRRTILEMLATEGDLPASDIYEKFTVSHAAISQHLKVLRAAHLVQVEKRAQQRIYTINTNAIQEVESWAGTLVQIWTERFDALDKLLEEEKKKLKI